MGNSKTQDKPPIRGNARRVRKSELVPPISPATPLRSRLGNVFWQLQINFDVLPEPIALPALPEPIPVQQLQADPAPQPAPAPKPPKQADPVKEKKPKQAAYTVSKEPTEQGIRNRIEFLEKVGDPKQYDEMRLIARKFISRSLNKTKNLRGLSKDEEEQIYMEFLHGTIEKIANKLECMDFIGKRNFMGYFFKFLEWDSSRFVKSMTKRMEKHVAISDEEDTNEDGAASTVVGQMAMKMSGIDRPMEGDEKEESQYIFDYIMEWVRVNVCETESDMLDADFFRRFYGLKQKAKDIAEETGYGRTRIARGYNQVMQQVKENIDLEGLRLQFQRRKTIGCDC